MTIVEVIRCVNRHDEEQQAAYPNLPNMYYSFLFHSPLIIRCVSRRWFA